MLLRHCCFHFDKTYFPLTWVVCWDHLSFNLLLLQYTLNLSCGTMPQSLPFSLSLSPLPLPFLRLPRRLRSLPSFSLFFGRLISMKTSDIVRKIIYVRNTCYHAVCLRPLWFYTENNCVLHVWYTKLNYKCSFYFFQQKSSSLCLSECFCNFAIHVYWT